MRRLARRGLFLAALLFAAPLWAGPPRDPARVARLRYTRGRGAERCPDERALASAVAARLGYDPFRDDAPRTVVVSVQGSGGPLRGEVTTTEAGGAVTGSRRIDAADGDCDELVASMALAISIAIDPEALIRAVPPPPERSPPPAPLPAAPSPAAPLPVPAPPPRRSALPPPSLVPEPLPVLLEAPRPIPLRWHVGLAVVVAAGAAPGLAGGVAVQTGVRRGALSASVESRADLPAGMAAPGRGSVRAALFTGSFLPCLHARAVAVCAAGSFGALRGEGAGVPLRKSDVTPFAALGLRLGVELPLVGVFSAGFHGDLAATLTRTVLRLDGRDVWSTPRASASLGVSVLAHFP